MTEYVVPNFSGRLVSAAQNHTTSAGVGLRVSSSADIPYHPPSSSEQSQTILANGPNTPPGSTRTAGEWVEAKIP